MVTQARLKELFDYNPETGLFTRNISHTNSVKVGDIAGCKGKRGYWDIRVDGKNLKAHRLAWLYMYGELPEEFIDHIDHNKINNRISNLRCASRTENQRNLGMRSDNTSGITGVTWHSQRGKWLAQIWVNGKKVHLGVFLSIDDAARARKDAEIKYSFHENHGK
jgi:hypothetical protein